MNKSTPRKEDGAMTRSLILAAAISMVLSGPAMAFHCPKDMAEIDAALAKNPDLTKAQLAEVTELRARGEEFHNGEDHQAAVDTLAKAMDILVGPIYY